jgi:hypothetical protein
MTTVIHFVQNTATAYMMDGSTNTPTTWEYQKRVAALVALTQEVNFNHRHSLLQLEYSSYSLLSYILAKTFLTSYPQIFDFTLNFGIQVLNIFYKL